MTPFFLLNETDTTQDPPQRTASKGDQVVPLKMANNATQSPPEVSPKPTESIEVDEEIKEEETGDGVGGMSRELYKEMRAICDVLSDHRISVRGDE